MAAPLLLLAMAEIRKVKVKPAKEPEPPLSLRSGSAWGGENNGGYATQRDRAFQDEWVWKMLEYNVWPYRKRRTTLGIYDAHCCHCARSNNA